MFFTYENYKSYLRLMKLSGEIVRFKDEKENNSIVLRHDVDLDVFAAYRLAKIEKSEDVLSSFFFMTTSHSYNVTSLSHREMLNEIADMGFEIGLHFDPSIYGDVDKQTLSSFLEREISILSAVIGKEIVSISLHNPSVKGEFPIFEGFVNAYDPLFFTDKYYLSDSRMSFRDKDPYKFLELINEHSLQILFHPLHFSEKGSSYPQIFLRYLYDHVDVIDGTFRSNVAYKDSFDSGGLRQYSLKEKS